MPCPALHIVEVNKYPPDLLRDGRFLRDDWTSCSDIGKTYGGRTVTRDDYLEAEARYLRAIHRFAELLALDHLEARGLERWDRGDRTLRRLGLDDVLTPGPAPREGEALPRERWDNVFRRCLREAAWLELSVPERFLVHFGYDLRVIIAIDADPAAAIAATRADGLFVHDSDPNVATLDRWRGIEA